MGQRTRKRGAYVPETSLGVCVWKLPDGTFLSDGVGYLSLNGVIGDKRVERKMRESAEYWLPQNMGKPHWIPGARKVTESEYDDQQERLREGKIPDPVDEYRQRFEK